ncbi:MAG: CHAT domain-containing protein [Candidatus Eisenbacteria bacterium]
MGQDQVHIPVVWGPHRALRAAVLACLPALLLGCARELPAPAREAVHFPQAESARMAGDYDAAVEAYLKSIAAEPRDPRPYFGLVESHYRRGDLDAVEPLLVEMSAHGPDSVLAPTQAACVRYGFACLAMRRQDLDGALAEALRTLALDPTLGHGHLLLGSVHYYAGRPDEALRAWSAARDVFRRQGDRTYEAWALNRTALVRRETGQMRPALAEFREALRFQEALGDSQAQQLILGNIGLTQADLGDLAAALVAFRRALALSRAAGDRDGECWGLTNLSYVHNLTGRHHRAIAYADSAIALARAVGNPVDELTGILSRATASLDLGDPAGALRASGAALALARELADPRQETTALTIRGRALLAVGRCDEARVSYARAESLLAGMEIETGSWEARIGLCEVAWAEGDTAAAITLAERTRADCAAAEYAEGEEWAALTLCELLRAQAAAGAAGGSRAAALLGEARAHADRAVDLSRRDGRRKREALALARRARVRFALAERSGATADAHAALEIAGAIGSPETLWECETAAGDVLPEEALAHYLAAIDAVEEIRRTLRIEEFKASFLAGRIEIYFKAARLFVEQGRHAEALAVCERSRARALRDLLATSPVPLEPRAAPPLIAQALRLEEEVRTLSATRAALLASAQPDRRRVRELDREIRAAKRAWEGARAEILLSDPGYGALAGGTPEARPERILSSLRTGEALVEYLVGSESTLCFVARGRLIEAVQIPIGGARLAEEVGRLLGPLQAPRSLALLDYDLDLAARLRERIFDPLVPLLEGTARLIVIPDGALHTLPFEALPLKDGTFLADHFTIEYRPAAALLEGGRGRTEPADRGGSGQAGVAQGRFAGRDGERVPLFAIGQPEGEEPRLAHAAGELLAVSAVYPGAECAMGAAATEEGFRTHADRCRRLHICTHGVIDEETPLYSGFRLAPDPAGRDDGFLQAYEILPLSLPCELVVLSACRSGRGRVYAGEGPLGLTRAFFHAGVQQAVVSLWSVDDRSTALLMERFHRGLAAGADAAEALREAKRALRDQTRPVQAEAPGVSYDHPYFWAPFVLIRARAG